MHTNLHLTMSSLKVRLKNLLEIFPPNTPVAYLDYPVHLNFGDLLIMRGTERFFSDYGYDIRNRHSLLNFHPRFHEQITKEMTIVLHGGGNFGDIYPAHQRFRERIIELYPDNKIVMLPQTAYFQDGSNLSRSAKIFKNHANLHLCARDKFSENLLRDNFSEKVHLLPDMAHQLWSAKDAEQSTQGDPLILLRNDVEADRAQELMKLNGPPEVDWIDLIPKISKKLLGRIIWLHRVEGKTGWNMGATRMWYRHCEHLHQLMQCRFHASGKIVSSRLHAVIFGSLLGKDIEFIDNSYGKLSAYIDTWLPDSFHLSRHNSSQRSV